MWVELVIKYFGWPHFHLKKDLALERDNDGTSVPDIYTIVFKVQLNVDETLSFIRIWVESN